MREQVVGCCLDDGPAVVDEFLVAADVATELLLTAVMVALVLAGDAVAQPGEVGHSDHGSVRSETQHVELGLRQACTHKHESQQRFRARQRTLANQRQCFHPGGVAPSALAGRARRGQLLEGREREDVLVRIARDDPVGDGDRVIGLQRLGRLAPRDGGRHERKPPPHHHFVLGQPRLVSAHAPTGRRPGGRGCHHVEAVRVELPERQRKPVELGSGLEAERVVCSHPRQVRAAAVGHQGKVEAGRAGAVERLLQVGRPQPVASDPERQGVVH